MIRARVFDYFGVLSDPDEKTNDTLKKLKDKGYLLGLLSNVSQKYLEDAIKKKGIKEYFAVVLASSIFGHAKPDPEFFEEIFKHLDVKAEEVLVIDDTHQHIASANNLGCSVHLFTSWQELYDELAKMGIL
jgi:HAD superfamily hydrolase (TIGR01509 family)